MRRRTEWFVLAFGGWGRCCPGGHAKQLLRLLHRIYPSQDGYEAQEALRRLAQTVEF